MDAAPNIAPWDRGQMTSRLAPDIPEGWYVDPAISMPTRAADKVHREVIVRSETGIMSRPNPAWA